MLSAALSGGLDDQRRERGRPMQSQYEKLAAMAEECRKLAALFEIRSIRSRLLEIAKHLEQWAEETVRNRHH